LADWQIFYYRSNAWSNPLSSEGAPIDAKATPITAPVVPDGVRLVLTLAPGQGISGVLTRDWMSPTLGGAK
jgi:general secretion pathway protein J